MPDPETEKVRDLWNRVADDWDIQVGTAGDRNRVFNSDPVLWAFAGDVAGRRVLDAGCGTGYLSGQLHSRGALVTGIDLSERMIAIARARHPQIDFRLDSCSELRTIPDGSFDLLIANYVLMDTPHLEAAVCSFGRVLCSGGIAVLVFSHPCFPQGSANASGNGAETTYRWNLPYFARSKRVDPPWGHFSSPFTWFHRPLSDYWKAFKAAGFAIVDFEEPRIAPERYHLVQDARTLANCTARPYSVAFKLQKA
jgi:ubiquinone/menaquinone biosynthesis C-methylase UbiE